MRIAIVGYGSLIWDLENLAPFVRGEWEMGTGPKMPVEFSRISPKRKQALVLCIDQTLSHQCQTCVIESKRGGLDDAITDLAKRERCAVDMIGYLDTTGRAYECFDAVEIWLNASDYDGVVWTALPANFKVETGSAFEHQVAVEYLQSLSEEQLQEAWQYIEFAPEVTDTPFRRFLKQNSFWQSLSYERVVA